MAGLTLGPPWVRAEIEHIMAEDSAIVERWDVLLGHEETADSPAQE